MTQMGLPLDPTPENAPATLVGAGTVITGTHCKCGCGAPLTGRQESFASRVCSSRWWDGQHPRVNVVPDGREGTIKELILGFLLAHAGEWFTTHQIGEAVRAFPHSVSARLAELRKRGHNIESDAVNGNSRRAHRFRLMVEGR